MVEAGRLGKKVGKGFYLWDKEGNHQLDTSIEKVLKPHMAARKTFTAAQMLQRLIYSMINEATLCLEEEVVLTSEAVDAALILGAGFPPFRGGLLRYSDTTGIEVLVDTLSRLSREVDGRFAPSKTLRKMAEAGEVFYP